MSQSEISVELLFSLVCVCVVPPTSGLYFSLDDVIYNPGSSINIADIGEQPGDRNLAGSTLVCVTTNVNTQCCRGRDNPNGGAIGGGWSDPSNTPIPAANTLDGATNVFARIVFTEQVRLAIVGTPLGPLGVYTCTVPDMNGVNVSATIMITDRTGKVCHNYNDY